MPRIDQIQAIEYGPDDPYHFHYDNLPLQNIVRRQELINSALDDLIEQHRDAIGDQGSLSNRLNQSLEENGSLKKDAVNDVLHDIGSHADDTWGNQEEYNLWIADRAAPFVRMQKSEADKLSNVADGATNLNVQIQLDANGDNVVTFDSGSLKLVPSTSVAYEVVSPNKLKFHLNFPVESVHKHFYNQEPVHENTLDPNYRNYKVNSASTPFISDSLRVYVNGVRVTDRGIYVPGFLVNDVWTLLSVTANHENGTFFFSNALSEEDIIVIDYDIKYIA